MTMRGHTSNTDVDDGDDDDDDHDYDDNDVGGSGSDSDGDCYRSLSTLGAYCCTLGSAVFVVAFGIF